MAMGGGGVTFAVTFTIIDPSAFKLPTPVANILKSFFFYQNTPNGTNSLTSME
jgi:hypothetical protein